MVAKLASQASKPDGILVIDGQPALQTLLKATPAARLPRCGGKVADTLTSAGVCTVADLQVRPVSAASCTLAYSVREQRAGKVLLTLICWQQ